MGKKRKEGVGGGYNVGNRESERKEGGSAPVGLRTQKAVRTVSQGKKGARRGGKKKGKSKSSRWKRDGSRKTPTPTNVLRRS